MSDNFTPVDMKEMMDEGVLMAANEEFFWKYGLALTWTVEDGEYVGSLHIREWTDLDGWNRETIALAPDDEVGNQRRERWLRWKQQRLSAMKPGEGGRA